MIETPKKDRTLIWGILLGVIVGVVVSKGMEMLRPAAADGEKEGLKRLSEQAEIFREATKQIGPSVVAIMTFKRVKQVEGYTLERERDAFGMWRYYRRPKMTEGLKLSSVGSGFLFDKENGYIMTNNHVVDGGEEFTIRLSDKRELQAKLVGADPQTDVAVLKVEAKDLPAAELGDSDKVEVGDFVLAAGNPFGFLEQTITAGIISAKGRKGLGLSAYEDFLQTDAAINQGNSGGPLVDLNGRVIGVNTAIYSQSGGYQGIGFAIPINQAKKVAEKLIKDKEVVRGWIGVEFEELSANAAKKLNIDGVGLAVRGLYRPGPAFDAGLQLDDVIVRVNGKEIKSSAEVRDLIADLVPGDKMDMKFLRKGTEMNKEVLLGRQPKDWGLNKEQ